MAENVAITAYRGEEDEQYRYQRLELAVAFAAGSASARHNIPVEYFFSNLLGVHDHKGALSCQWRNSEAAHAFGAVMADAWEVLGEPADLVEHFDHDGRFVTRGRAGRRYIAEVCEMHERWPGYKFSAACFP
jgi:hypothetical protein